MPAALWRVVHRVSSSLLGPAVPSFRALSGHLKFTVRRHTFNKDAFLSKGVGDMLRDPTEEVAMSLRIHCEVLDP